MTIPCPSCHALHWPAEKLKKSPVRDPRFGTCCDSGQVNLPFLAKPPPLLYYLYESDDPLPRAFRKHIRQYNNAFAFTSLGVNEDRALNRRGGSAWVFRIHGELCHLSSALERTDGLRPCFAQVYIYDPSVAHSNRVANNDNLDPSLLMELEVELRASNPYAAMYMHAHEFLASHVTHDALIRLRVTPGLDRRRYNRPTAEEVAMILPGDDSAAQKGRDIILRRRTPLGGSNLFRISELHAAYAPLQFVLLFPRGESGWHDELRMHQPATNNPLRLTQIRHAAFRLQVRPLHVEYNTILRGGQLMQQYVVDMWASAEQNRLNFLRGNQLLLRAELYNGVADAICSADSGHINMNTVGRVILPSSHVGGPRDLQQRYQDAMALARFYRKVDLFITLTANP
ncbi:uncharacterized protein SCHCODRAFT_02477374, partial [Schizophyllum commune H4-8]|uniref:uncharacterized protein n=1 Tax=Schizophyllum commune (strain H4-8 / FGSC 9210) TaxID=578458 RepID=UPI00215DDE4C